MNVEADLTDLNFIRDRMKAENERNKEPLEKNAEEVSHGSDKLFNKFCEDAYPDKAKKMRNIQDKSYNVDKLCTEAKEDLLK